MMNNQLGLIAAFRQMQEEKCCFMVNRSMITSFTIALRDHKRGKRTTIKFSIRSNALYRSLKPFWFNDIKDLFASLHYNNLQFSN